jgi:hypothetical protein
MAAGRSNSIIRQSSPLGAAAWRLTVLWLLGGCLVVVVLVLGQRRLTGALPAPLPAGLLVPTFAAATLLAGLLRWLLLVEYRKYRVLPWSASVLLLLLAAALWLPGTNRWAISAVCLLLVCELTFGVVLRHGPRPLRSSSPARGPSAEVLQTLTRRRTERGQEQIDGTYVVRFVGGQRTENCHVAFCPPLPTAEVSCRQLAGPPARLKLAQVLPQGARIELRLAEPAEEEACVLLEIIAKQETHQPRTQA